MIHPTAVIDKKAQIDEGVSVGPYAVIEAGVVLEKNVRVGPYVHVKGDTRVGEGTFIGTGAVVGELPQIVGCKENNGKLRIGKNNVIREYVTIHVSSSSEKVTSLGDNNFLMGFSHVGHDCRLQNSVVVCNGALVAGHVDIGDRAFVSGGVVVHQFVRIGRLAMIGGLSRVNQDVPPFMMLVGDSRIWGLNLVGLKRAGFKPADIARVKQGFNVLYRQRLSQSGALEKLKTLDSAAVKEIVDFVQDSKRGICGPQKNSLWEKIFLDYPYFARTRIEAYDIFLRCRRKTI